MKIESIEMTWFRGSATGAKLNSTCKSVVVYGDNACGKSSFVDAVEFLITNGKIRHLKNEFSDPNNCIRNTEIPDDQICTAKITLEKNNFVEAEIPENGKIVFKSNSPAILGALQSWDLQRHILRQDEVAEFIHLTKSDKYSMLSPLLGLQTYEEMAQNISKVKDAILKKSGHEKLLAELSLIEADVCKVLPKVDYQTRKKLIYERALKHAQVKFDESLESIANQAIFNINSSLKDQEPQVKRYLVMQSLDRIQLGLKLQAVIKSQNDLAKISEVYLDLKIPILENSEKIIESIIDLKQEIECPACGRGIIGNDFKDHIIQELETLKKAREATNQAVSDKQSFTISFSNFISQYKNERAFLEWLALSENRVIKSLFFKLEQTKVEPVTNRWSTEFTSSLQAILNDLSPLIEKEANIKAPATVAIVNDLTFFQVCLKIPRFEYVAKNLAKINILTNALENSQLKIREEINKTTEQVLKEISKDIARIWAIIHPNQPIENVHLSPSEKDKAIEVCLKFYGKEQSDPRLTLSEGYRNSLGLSIFLALANQGKAKENPILLDDIVSSLDREHRGMVTQLLRTELKDRQVFLFTHDREWFGELTTILESEGNWKFFSLKKWDSPKVGIELLPTTYTFDEAEGLLASHVGLSGNAVRAIMDTELPKAAENLKLSLPYLRGHHNDTRMAVDFLEALISEGEQRYKIKQGTGWKINNDAIQAWKEAKALLIAWANRASHGGSLSPPEAKQLIESCKTALSHFCCQQQQCGKKVWSLEAADKYVQCNCGFTRWKIS